ncbi:hypothetical protein RDI58_013490 [Solanum bulbocastanum]|uniref:Uncharacterized protein n=1 Tax=Solanum bulbocastanum TaxID=147425 RepID=A0AAN8TMB2_SOLBU
MFASSQISYLNWMLSSSKSTVGRGSDISY